MTRWSMAARVLVSGIAVGCTGDGGDATDSAPTGTGACTEEAPTVTVGTGDVSFVALNDGDTVNIVFGPQGGWHIDVGGSVTNMNQEVAVTPSVTLISQSTQIAGDQEAQFLGLASYDDATCSGQFWGVRAFVDDVTTPPLGLSYAEMICTFEDQELEFCVTVEDITNGGTVSDCRTVVAKLDPAALAACP